MGFGAFFMVPLQPALEDLDEAVAERVHRVEALRAELDALDSLGPAGRGDEVVEDVIDGQARRVTLRAGGARPVPPGRAFLAALVRIFVVIHGVDYPSAPGLGAFSMGLRLTLDHSAS